MSDVLTIFKNNIYTVIVKEGKYILINNETEVEEFETTLMPEAIHYAIELQADVYKIQEKINEESVTVDTVTEH
jgi:hypothetical protein